MKILDRYLGKAVIAGALLALMLLVSINVLIDFVNEAEDVGTQGYTYLHAALRTVYTIPLRVYQFFPTALLIGSLLSLGNLATHNELVVMQAAGVSVYRIIGSVMKTGVFLLIGILLLSEFVVPMSEQESQKLRNVTQTKRVQLGGRDGLWAKDGDRFVNVREIYPGRRLLDIWVYEVDEHQQLKNTTHIDSAVYKNDQWLLKGVSSSEITAEGVTVKRQPQVLSQRLLEPDLFDVVTLNPKKMSGQKLSKYIDYLKANDLDSRRYELAFWKRYTFPVSGVLMLLLAVPFVFGSARTGGAGQKLFIGIIIGVIFNLAFDAINNLGLVYGLPPSVGATLPLILLLILGSIAVKRVT